MERLGRPAEWRLEHGSRWQDADAASAYRFRPPYAAEAFNLLESLIRDEPRVVLDIGCGTGAIARPLAPRVARVDAVDLSAQMIAEGRMLPGGNAENLRWSEGSAERAQLDGPYALIVGGQSLHWMDWRIVLPRFAALLSARGVLAAVATEEVGDEPWREPLREIVVRHSTIRSHVKFELFPALERAGLCRHLGEHTTSPVVFEQPVEEFIAAHHAMSSLTRAHIDASAFDAELRDLLAPYCPDGVLRRRIPTWIGWGLPIGKAGPH